MLCASEGAAVKYGAVLIVLALMVLPCCAPFTPAVRSAHLSEGHTGVQWPSVLTVKNEIQAETKGGCHV